jgi:Zn-finger nucleic acid-binding protein
MHSGLNASTGAAEAEAMSGRTEAMRCHVDGATPVMSERSSIEIDSCPTCHGVWLDRGELDKIIERSGQAWAPSSRREPMLRLRADGGRGYGHDRSHDFGSRKRKKSFLEKLFD